MKLPLSFETCGTTGQMYHASPTRFESSVNHCENLSVHIFGYFNFWNIYPYFLVLQAHEGHVHSHHHVQNISSDLQLPVSVFYEALCPDSIKFFKEQLVPTYKALGKYINLNFVPFGKARQVSAYFPVQSVVHTLTFILFSVLLLFHYSF